MFKPRPHQSAAIAKGVAHYAGHARGKLVMAFRSGKTVTAALLAKRLGVRSIVFLTPTLPLQKQSVETWAAIFPQSQVLCIGSDKEVAENLDAAVGVTTSPDEVLFFLEKNQDMPILIFCTYMSSRALAIAAEETGTGFDFGVFDEAHRTAGGRDNLYPLLLHDANLRIGKRLFMTATEKFFRGNTDEVASMDDEALYGTTFYRLSVADAIRKGILCDYSMVTMWFTSDEIAGLIDQVDVAELGKAFGGRKLAMRTLTAAVATVHALQEGTVSKLIVYHDSIRASKQYASVLRRLLDHFAVPAVDVEHVDGGMNGKYNALGRFRRAKKAVVSNCRLILEGFDAPSCDGVLFAVPKSSVIDISQMAGRVMTKDGGKERGHVIIPAIVGSEAEFYKSDDYANLRLVVAGMAAADDRITHTLPKGAGPSRGKHLRVWASAGVTRQVDVAALTASMRLKVWRHVSRLNWMAYEEARAWVAENLPQVNSCEKWKKVKAEDLDPRLPIHPQLVYKSSGWQSWPAWFGREKQDFMGYEDARRYVVENLVPAGVTTQVAYKIWAKERTEHRLPANPAAAYKEWSNWPAWFGREKPSRKPSRERLAEYWPFEKARAWVRRHKEIGKTVLEFRKNIAKLPAGIPSNPQSVYADQFKGYADWFGKKDRLQKTTYTYEDARRWVAENLPGIRTSKEWQADVRAGQLPDGFPYKPAAFYKKSRDWKGWDDFLGK